MKLESNPYSQPEMKTAVLTLKENLNRFFSDFSEQEFFQKPAKGWSPAENLNHINKVTKLLGLTFYSPKFISSLIFGEREGNSRSLAELAAVYFDGLNKGVDSGPFTPGEEKPDEKITLRKAKLLDDWNKSMESYSRAIDSWKEEDLDKVQMLHPFLGKIPVREMYMIGFLHPVHHANILANRLEKEIIFF